ncbi:hypothetical protein FEM33_20275 [Dyadobacter flavalbus]|uniref:ParA family protein n=2 Tax=Dyadobacter flavalbus TaxID=2579942 RepID=A0A5M8QLK4_9BACT|nr:hypothetical protein FEM33_20275 [Dyadobacter flavalbus]
MMKQVHFIMQSKGGVGKSLLAALIGLKSQNSESTAFVDLDCSTKSSMRQLKFLGGNRLEAVSLLNEKEVLVRDNLVSYLESLVNTPFEEIIFDFGAPESEQFPALIERDLPFEEFMDMLQMKVNYHIVIGGGSAYIPSVQFLQNLYRIVDNKTSLTVWASITTFNHQPMLLKELQQNCDKLGLKLCKFGDFDPQSHLGGQILDSIRLGIPLEEYSPGSKLRMRKELTENINF